jgi:hypothetical protein
VTISIKNTRAITNCDAIVDDCDLGSTNPSATLRIYAGTVPTDVDTALTGQTLLAELVMSNPAFGAAADINPGARATASAVTNDSTANNTGTATFFRIFDRNDVARLQGTASVSGGGGDLQLNSAAIQSGTIVSITALTITQPEA